LRTALRARGFERTGRYGRIPAGQAALRAFAYAAGFGAPRKNGSRP
jgi:hypothetical protein